MEEVRGQMGSKKWTVVYESGEGAAIESLRDTVDSMKAEYDKKFKVVEDITVVPFVGNNVPRWSPAGSFFRNFLQFASASSCVGKTPLTFRPLALESTASSFALV